MESQRLEVRVQEIAAAVLAGRPVEDNQVELKAEWPEPGQKVARQIAGHANAARGERILWVIGLDERGKRAMSATGVEVADWWASTSKWLDEESPSLEITLSVRLPGGQRVMALQLSTDRAPYVVRTGSDTGIHREVPWREGNATRSARRHEVLQSVVSEVLVPQLELIGAQVTLHEVIGKRPGVGEYDDSGRPMPAGQHYVRCAMHMFLSANGPATLPQHRQKLRLSGSSFGPVEFPALEVRGPYRFNGYSQSGGRRREPAGAIQVLGHSGIVAEGSGELSLDGRVLVSTDVGRALRRARRVTVSLTLPVDRSVRASSVTGDLAFVAGSGEDSNERQEYETSVLRARFAYGSEAHA